MNEKEHDWSFGDVLFYSFIFFVIIIIAGVVILGTNLDKYNQNACQHTGYDKFSYEEYGEPGLFGVRDTCMMCKTNDNKTSGCIETDSYGRLKT
jgi:hypothetical protein